MTEPAGSWRRGIGAALVLGAILAIAVALLTTLWSQPRASAAEPPGTVHVADAAGLAAAVAGPGVVLVDFHASWCGPCHLLADEIGAAATQRPGAFRLVKVDVDQAGALAQQFGITQIPVLVRYVDGKEAGRQLGVMRAAALLAWVASPP